MLRDAKFSSFRAVYVVCGFTDMRFGIDSLATIIKERYKLPIFVPNTLFLFCGRRANKIKGLLWEEDGYLLLTKRVEEGRFTWPRNSSDRIIFVPNADFSSPFFRFPLVPVPHEAAPFIPVVSVLSAVYRLSLFSITLHSVIVVCLF